MMHEVERSKLLWILAGLALSGCGRQPDPTPPDAQLGICVAAPDPSQSIARCPDAPPPASVQRFLIGQQLQDQSPVLDAEGKPSTGIVLSPLRAREAVERAIFVDLPFGQPNGSALSDCGPVHYLMGTLRNGAAGFNSFDWWGRSPPLTSRLSQEFRCEFSQALGLVVGSVVVSPTGGVGDLDPTALGFRMARWDNRLDEPAPNSDDRIGFTIRTSSPSSTPTLRARGQLSGGSAVVLVNESQSDLAAALAPNEWRPSLWLDFDSPRRAVGIEFTREELPGLLPADVDASGVKLMAYDRDDRFIVGASGRGCQLDGDGLPVREVACDAPCSPGSDNVRKGNIRHCVGVQDRLGRISRTELRFDYANAAECQVTRREAGNPPPSCRRFLDSQVVYRIWHEPLPPAAVLQGVAGRQQTVANPNHQPRLVAEGNFKDRYGVDPGNVSICVPYRFDRAVAFLRGFRVVRGNRHERLRDLHVKLDQDRHEFARTDNEIDDPCRLRSVTLQPSGLLDAGTSVPTPFRVLSYYTLLGWDSDQADLSLRRGATVPVSPTERWLEVRRTGSTVHQAAIGLDGPQGDRLFGGLQSFRFTLGAADLIDDLSLAIGEQRFVGQPDIDSLSLRRVPSGAVAWGLLSNLTTPDDRIHNFEAEGTVIGGSALALKLGRSDVPGLSPEDRLATRNSAVEGDFSIALASVGRRPPNPSGPGHEYNIPLSMIRGSFKLAWPLQGEVAAVGLQHVFGTPNGPIQELDVETIGRFYDGRVVDWEMGLGVDVQPGLVGGIDPEPERRHLFAFPVFAAVKRQDTVSARARFVGLDVSGAIPGCSNPYPQQRGFIENLGPAALLVTGVSRSPQRSESFFEHTLHWKGLRMRLDDVAGRAPLHLAKGERLELSTTFTPPVPAAGGVQPAPQFSVVTFRTLRRAVSSRPDATIPIIVSGQARPGRPAAQWVGTGLNFGFVPSGASRTLSALLRSTGDVELCIQRLFLENPRLGFRIGSPLQWIPDPENAAGRVLAVPVVCDTTGVVACSGRTELLAQTNSVTSRLPVFGNVLQAAGPQ